MSLSNAVCHRPVAQMSETVRTAQGRRRGDGKLLRWGPFVSVSDNNHTIDVTEQKDGLFKPSDNVQMKNVKRDEHWE